jgi:TonB-linked SusC/RagA family outer membrane protein
MNRYLTLFITFLCLQVFLLQRARAQVQDQRAVITVTDQDGHPVYDAGIWYNDGASLSKTNQAGKAIINRAKAGKEIRIEASGYTTKLIPVDSITYGENIITLHSSNPASGTVELPFGHLTERRIVGAVTSLHPEEILQYDNNENIMAALNGRVAGLYNSRDIRGLGNAVVVIDGIPRSSPDNSSRLNMADDLNLLEIKEITVLKDATSKMLYGAKADQGVILITTKRGTPFKRRLKVYAETGLSNPVSYPEYLAASDYMILYNEALRNDGLAAKYSNADIQNTYDRTDPVRYPDESFYNDQYLKANALFFNVRTEASGGNENAQYFTSLGFSRNGSLYKIKSNTGQAASEDHLNFRGNVDLKINSWIHGSLDAVAIYNYNRYPNGYYGNGYDGDFFEFAGTQLPNAYPSLIPVDLVQDSSLLKSAKLIDGKYLLGGTNQFGNNILGNLVYGGMQSTQQKAIQFNAGLQFDLSALAKGLSANANFTYDFLNSYTLRQNNTYAVYEPSYVKSAAGEDSLTVTQYGTDLKRDDQTVNGNYFQRRYGFYGTLHYIRTFNTVHQIDATALAYMSAYSVGNTGSSNFVNNRDQHFGLRVNYALRSKYIAEFDGVYTGSSYLSMKKRYAFSPSLGAAWIMSEEGFLADSRAVNYLKIKASYGITNTDDGYEDYHLYKTTYTRGGSFDYNNGSGNTNQVTQFGEIGNPDLGFVKQKELNAGFEASLASNTLWLEASYFDIRTVGEPVIRSNAYPSYLGGFIPMENYNEYKHTGVEADIHYTNKAGKFAYTVGGNMVYAMPRSVKLDEVPHAYAYQYQQGKVSDALFGLVAEGLFKDQADIDNHAKQSYGPVQPGDIKYKDVNNDGVINDDDRVQIGNFHPRFQYGIDIDLKLGRWELFALGTAQTGSNIYFNNAYYWVYGNRKYSAMVLNRWTPETAATATYPRLTTTNGSNNFRNSTFWLYDDRYFTLNRAQLTYHLPEKFFWKGLQLYVRGNNLLTVSPIRKQLELNIASAPQMRSYMVGIVGSF